MILVEKKKNKNKITITFEGRVSCIYSYNVKRGNFSRVFSYENYFAFFSFIG